MPTVNRFESNLLHILQGLLSRAPLERWLPLVRQELPRPACLSRACVHLVESTLARGCVIWLMREQAWHSVRFLRGNVALTGSLWQRTSPAELGLAFSPLSLDLLQWLTATNLSQPGPAWKIRTAAPLATGDLVLLFLVVRQLAGTPLAASFVKHHPFATHALCRLAYPDVFTGVAGDFDFRPWLAPPLLGVLETLQGFLAERWREVELNKAKLPSAEAHQALAWQQERVLSQFLDDMGHSNRRDLARFLLIAGDRLFRDEPGNEPAAYDWMASLARLGGRLAERFASVQRLLTVPRQFERLRDWQRAAMHVGYVDEGYAAAQLWKSDWEELRGEHTCDAAHSLVRKWEALGMTG